MTSIEAKIAKDLDLIDIVEVLGTPSAKRKARKHRAEIFNYLRETTPPELADMTDDELLAELSA